MTEVNDLLQRLADRLEKIEAGIGAMHAEIAAVRTKTDRIEADLSAVRAKTDAQPDMRLMFQNTKLLLERMVMMERDMSLLRSAMNDYGRESVTPGEITAIQDALDTLREADLNREARLRVLEAHLPR